MAALEDQARQSQEGCGEDILLRPVFRVEGAEILPLDGAGSVPKASGMLPCGRGNAGNSSAGDGALRERSVRCGNC